MRLRIPTFTACLILLISGCGYHQQIEEVRRLPATKIISAEVKIALPASILLAQKDLWVRLRQGLDLDQHYSHPELDKKKHWDQNKQNYINQITANGSRYMYHIISELEANNIPLELALLPAIESGYNPLSHSHKYASGLWQFIPATARRYGLKKDPWYDARLDPVASTSAAITYLKYLHRRFDGDWLLAIAAYNGGEGKVKKAIKKNEKKGRPTDFWSLGLPKETRSYVPRLLMLSRMVANPKKYNIDLPLLVDQPYFASIDLADQIDISQAARMAGVDVTEMRLLNPGYKLGITHPESPQILLLPLQSKEIFLASLKKTPKEEWSPIKIYTVKQGDTLSEIAFKYGLSTESLVRSNTIHSHIIQIGQKIKLPGAELDSSSAVHRVRDGDSLWRIAKKYNVSIKNIAAWNDIDLKKPLKIGEELKIGAN